MNLGRWIGSAIAAALLAGVAGAEPAPAAGPMYVQVESASVKAKPVGFSPTVAYLKRGDQVEVLGAATSGYVPVRYGEGKNGFVLEANLVTQERYKEVEKESVGAKETGESYAAHAAAKGWDKETETAYAKDKKLDREFEVVSRIEKGPYPARRPEEIEKVILQFASEGKLGEAAVTQ